MNIHQIPFVRILIPYTIGLVIGWFTLSYTIATAIAIVSVLIFALCRIFIAEPDYNQRYLSGIYISLFFVAVGVLFYNISMPEMLKGRKMITSYEVYKYEQEYTTPGALEQKALSVRDKLIEIYREHTPEASIDIISAITLGKKDYLSRDTRNAFSMSGGSHVLAVSGLHVGIIYMIMVWLANRLPRKRGVEIASQVVTIITLWGYAFICGLPASVVRSALMFSLLSVAVIVERRSVSLNAVFVSAFIMLVYKPLYMLSIGFQLSYAAVISILLFFSKFNSMLELHNKILIWIWSMISVSAAAQIGTMPLTVYYFHQIPTYSLLTNFLVVPAAFIIIYLCATMLAFHKIPAISDFAGRAVHRVTEGMREGIDYISSLPDSVIGNLYISHWTIYLLFIMILLLYFFTETRKASYLIATLSVIVIMQSVDIITLCMV